MPPISAHAAPADTRFPADPVTGSPHGAAFIERARHMVAFLAAGDGGQDRELGEWITRWRTMRRGLDATQHFVAEELGIIVRALNGPAAGARLRDQRTDDLCWRIARCMADRP